MNKLPTFHCGALETFSGPVVGTLSDIINLPLKTRDQVFDGKPVTTAGDLLNIILNNSPYLNLTYVRPALDTLFINALRNTSWSKSLQRQYDQRQKQYGQSHFDLIQAITGRR
ncbi:MULTISPECIES: hypothetical protein [unclassified Rhizobium]|uniref:hypothetical protein n=1 Tax=unclassified Rhizobium TaxID=2613769 RepID=UPI001610367F|nr:MULTISPECIES: hypothetical protein [unclassified Rhizobium]MBB3288749.1 hypothetical protein [Rhizobium sp. BK252]MBB3403491.1 hypothetical protein [Rhizobium sp. BK289]MBB3416324.1 hypothetical protein [Rhizobium sp. BK284]MBB3483954.1 hypothetical protein [Rhizobium sp. BK347]